MVGLALAMAIVGMAVVMIMCMTIMAVSVIVVLVVSARTIARLVVLVQLALDVSTLVGVFQLVGVVYPLEVSILLLKKLLQLIDFFEQFIVLLFFEFDLFFEIT